MDRATYDKMKAEAILNQMDPITAGRNYNQSDIKAHVNKLAE